MQLTTTTTGSGPRRVALVHGLGADGGTWGPFIERLAATGRYSVTTVDLRGHGASARAESYRVDDMADDLVESLPTGLHSIVGHSLGGAVLVRAISRLAPERAIYLDPGFALSLPTTGIAGRLFWLAPLLPLGFAQLAQSRRSAAARAAYSPETRALIDDAQKKFDRRMAVGVFRDVAFHPVPVEAPAVPSTIVLSDQSAAVLPDALAARLEQKGWEVRRLAGVQHDMQLEAPDRTFEAIADRL
jgi:pimeloyl-ACP methyl ester carboxylesterase